MFGVGRNGNGNNPPPEEQGPPEAPTQAQLIAQRKFRVRHDDGKDIVEEIIICRMIRESVILITFADVVTTRDGVMVEDIVKAISTRRYISHEEVLVAEASILIS